MPVAPPHHDPATARAETTRAIDAARDHADAEWYKSAYAAGVHLCRTQRFWIVDDLQAILAAGGLGQPREPRAIGAVVRQLRIDGLCEGTDTYKPSARKGCHQNPRRTWKSLGAAS
jgi:hypothetical protein